MTQGDLTKKQANSSLGLFNSMGNVNGGEPGTSFRKSHQIRAFSCCLRSQRTWERKEAGAEAALPWAPEPGRAVGLTAGLLLAPG